jgi:hypothetical protein
VVRVALPTEVLRARELLLDALVIRLLLEAETALRVSLVPLVVEEEEQEAAELVAMQLE